MKLNRKTLRRMILSEIKNLRESSPFSAEGNTALEDIMDSNEWYGLTKNLGGFAMTDDEEDEALENFEDALVVIVLKLVPGVAPNIIGRYVQGMSHEHQENLRSMVNTRYSARSAVEEFLTNLASNISRF
tara:strand:- start:510 stop:899 length:390 start_codon:yes stop_codon:yes gene_type:complete